MLIYVPTVLYKLTYGEKTRAFLVIALVVRRSDLSLEFGDDALFRLKLGVIWLQLLSLLLEKLMIIRGLFLVGKLSRKWSLERVCKP